MRILHTESSTELGGQELRVLEEAIGMQARGHTVILAVDSESQLAFRARTHGIPLEPIPMKKRQAWPAILNLLRAIEKYGIHVINTHGSFDSWAGAIAGRLSRRKPLIVRTRHKSTPIRKNLRNWILYRKLPHALVTTGNRIRQDLIHQFQLEENRISSIPTGVDFKRFRPLDADERLKHELGIESGHQIVGTIAFLRNNKGLEDFVEAARQILRRMPEVRFLIVGSGKLADTLTVKIQKFGLTKKMILTGFREDIPQVLALMDVFVLPSTKAESIPQALIQALAMQRAVVTTSVGGIPEVIQDGKNGFLVSPGDCQGLTEKITLLLEDVTLQQTFGLAGRKIVLERFGHDTMLDQTEEFYTGCLNSIRPEPFEQEYIPSIQHQLDLQEKTFVPKSGMPLPFRWLEEVPIKDIQVVTKRGTWFRGQNHQRTVYYDAAERIYFKIWDADYIRAQNFLEALNVDFFGDSLIPAMGGLIVDSQYQARGYFTHAGTLMRKVPLNMFLSLLQSTAKTGLFYYEFHHGSVIVFQGKTSFIDLESVYPLQRLPQMRGENVAVRPKAYKKLLERMSKELYQNRERKINSTTLATFERWKDLICEMDIILQ